MRKNKYEPHRALTLVRRHSWEQKNCKSTHKKLKINSAGSQNAYERTCE